MIKTDGVAKGVMAQSGFKFDHIGRETRGGGFPGCNGEFRN